MKLSDKHKEMVRKGDTLRVLQELIGVPGRIRAVRAYQDQLSCERKQIVKQNKALNKWANRTFFGG